MAFFVPIARVHLALVVVALDEDGAPVTGAVFVHAETFTGDGGEVAVDVVAEFDPLFGEAAVVLGIVEGLEREPIGGVLLGVAIIDTEFSEELLDVK